MTPVSRKWADMPDTAPVKQRRDDCGLNDVWEFELWQAVRGELKDERSSAFPLTVVYDNGQKCVFKRKARSTKDNE